jgi:ribosomal protein S18 acetylase RimI-like enzyme
VPEDESFMFAVYASTRAEELQLVDWTDEQKLGFVQMQFNAQKVSYEREYPEATYHVVLADDIPAGRLIVDRSDNCIAIIDIAVLPDHRDRGIGASLLQSLQHEAEKAGKKVSLYVENFNRASRLYERLGFVRVAEQGIYSRMEWAPTVAQLAQVG